MTVNKHLARMVVSNSVKQFLGFPPSWCPSEQCYNMLNNLQKEILLISLTLFQKIYKRVIKIFLLSKSFAGQTRMNK